MEQPPASTADIHMYDRQYSLYTYINTMHTWRGRGIKPQTVINAQDGV